LPNSTATKVAISSNAWSRGTGITSFPALAEDFFDQAAVGGEIVLIGVFVVRF
jgi:hypothetical protein